MPLLSSKHSFRNLASKQSESSVVVKPPYIPKHTASDLCATPTVPFTVPESFQFFDSNINNPNWSHQSSMSFAISSTDYAYLHLEVVCNDVSPATSTFSHPHSNNPNNTASTGKSVNTSIASLSKNSDRLSTSQSLYFNSRSFDLDLICWKVIVTKAMGQHLGISGQAIPTDIIHVLNPRYQRSVINKRRRPQRRYLSSTGSQSSLSDSSDISPDPSHPSIVYKTRGDSFSKPISRRSSTCSSEDDCTNNSLQDSEKQQQNPEAWIRVPESELTNAWTALSGFATSIDTGNYGTINVGVRVIRASRYLPSVSGSHRNRW